MFSFLDIGGLDFDILTSCLFCFILASSDKNDDLANSGQVKELENYLAYLEQEEEFDKKTIRIRKVYLVPFVNSIKKPLNEVTIEDVREYVKSLEKSPQTIFRTKWAIKHLFKYLDEYHNFNFPYLRIRTTKPTEGLRECCSPDDFDRIDKYIHSQIETRRENLRIHALVHLLWESGIRRCEALNIEIKNVDLTQKLFYVISPKTDKGRIGYFSIDLTDYIKEFKPKKYLFEISESRVSIFIRKICRIAVPEKKLSPHCFRHGFVTRLLDNGAPVTSVSLLAGHSKLDTTMHYYHTYANELKNVYDSFIQPPKTLEFKAKVGKKTKYNVELRITKNK